MLAYLASGIFFKLYVVFLKFREDDHQKKPQSPHEPASPRPPQKQRVSRCTVASSMGLQAPEVLAGWQRRGLVRRCLVRFDLRTERNQYLYLTAVWAATLLLWYTSHYHREWFCLDR